MPIVWIENLSGLSISIKWNGEFIAYMMRPLKGMKRREGVGGW